MMSRTMERFVFRTVSQVSNKVPAWEAILARLSDQECDAIGEEDLWEYVSNSQESPHFGNAYQYLLLSRIKRLTEEQYPNVEVDYFINALDSHLYLNEVGIWECCLF
jgi:hypothetical protein